MLLVITRNRFDAKRVNAFMNRHDRRKGAKLYRAGHRSLRLRCVGCDRVGRRMTDEHFFPKWLIKHADARRDGIDWLGRRGVHPRGAVMPLCSECNQAFANVLEGPISTILPAIEAGEGLSDAEAELLVRWMWKFEGLQWSLSTTGVTEALYTERFTLVERVTSSDAFDQIRPQLLLAIAMCNANDEGFLDWPLGLDTPPSDNAIHMSGAFGRTAIITSLADFAEQIPDVYGKYVFGSPPVDRGAKTFFPPVSFVSANAAIAQTKETAKRLTELHELYGAARRREHSKELAELRFTRARIELPPV
jgi:hypothetical protein